MKFLKEIISRVRYNKKMFDDIIEKIDLYLDSNYDINCVMIDVNSELNFLSEEKVEKTLRQQIEELDDDYDIFIKNLLSEKYEFSSDIIETVDMLEQQNYFEDNIEK